jgi:hypothetical protein
MMSFVSWEHAKELALHEPVVFAEIMSDAPTGHKLEVHVMTPTRQGMHELERDDTGDVPAEEVPALLARIAAQYNAHYAAIRGAEEQWPPRWADSAP